MNDRIVYAHLRASGPRAGSIFYVGQGARRRMGSSEHKTQAWIDTVAEFGVVGFVLADGLTSDEARALEAAVVLVLRPWLTNARAGGGRGPSVGKPTPMLGRKHTPEAIAKITERMRTNHPMKGRKGADNPLTGRKNTPEAIANITASNWMRGKKHSEETKAKMKAAYAKRKAEKNVGSIAAV